MSTPPNSALPPETIVSRPKIASTAAAMARARDHLAGMERLRGQASARR
jgi:hypothetical protein